MGIFSKTRIVAFVAAFLLAVTGIEAKYTVHTLTGDVQARRSGKALQIAVGTELNPTDDIIIGEGGKIEILNTANSLVFTSVKPGRTTVTKIIIDAQAQADDQRGTIVSKLRIGKSDTPEGFMYAESGKVTRALTTFDPSGDSLMVESHLLSNYIAATLRSLDRGEPLPALPVEFRADSVGGGMGFEVTNTFDFPIYMNVIKLSAGDPATVSISELGQPIGSYVLLPRQTLARRQADPAGDGERHLVVVTHYNFDIDDLTTQLGQILGAGAPILILNLDNPPIYLRMIE